MPAADEATILPKAANYWTDISWRTLWAASAIALDAFLLGISFYCAWAVRFHTRFFVVFFPFPHGDILHWAYYAGFLPPVIFVWLFILWYGAGIYREPSASWEDLAFSLLKGCLQGWAAMMALSFLYHRLSDSRLVFVVMIPFAFASLLLGHRLLGELWSRARRALAGEAVLLLVGDDRTSQILDAKLSKLNHRRILTMPPACAGDIRRKVRECGVSELFLTNSGLDREGLLSLADEFEGAGVDVRIVPSLLELRMGEIQIDQAFGIPTLRLRHCSLSGVDAIVKRLFDVIFSLCVFAVGFIPALVIGLLIKADSKGPILFRQRRIGYRGRAFEVFKFRTMVADAEDRLMSLRAAADGLDDPIFFKAKDDPRITRVGRWLRRLSLDEFPQFINVLRGEMSVVGPRPMLVAGELPELERRYGKSANKILNARPGITGLWQVSGRSDISDEKRFDLDLYYIEHWSPGLDLRIILKTIPAMLFAKGAY
jgi:exopolysaccharide biosynthesis polyprenyl glycosylphosphotransferase